MAIKILKTEERWVTAKDGESDAEFLIRPIDYRVHQRAIRQLASTPEKERWLHYCELIAPEILKGWKGILDEDGKPVTFDLELALGGLSDRVWAQLIGEAVKEVNEAEAIFRGSKNADQVAEDES